MLLMLVSNENLIQNLFNMKKQTQVLVGIIILLILASGSWLQSTVRGLQRKDRDQAISNPSKLEKNSQKMEEIPEESQKGQTPEKIDSDNAFQQGKNESSNLAVEERIEELKLLELLKVEEKKTNHLSSKESEPQQRVQQLSTSRRNKRARRHTHDSFIVNFLLKITFLGALPEDGAHILAVFVIEIGQFILSALMAKMLIRKLNIRLSDQSKLCLRITEVGLHLLVAAIHENNRLSDFFRLPEFIMTVSISTCLAYMRRDQGPLPAP